MEKIYLRAYYMKSLHYFFFALAVFSLGSGVIFFQVLTVESLSFLGLSVFYFLSSETIAYYYYRGYRQFMDPFIVVRTYLIPYMALTLWTIGSLVAFVLFFPSILPLIRSFLFIDYYIFFLIVLGFVFSRMKVVSGLFRMYDKMGLRRAMRIAKRRASSVDVDTYSIGSDPRIDEILDDILTHEDNPESYVRALEIAVCERHIANTSRIVNNIRKRGAEEEEKDLLESMKKIRESYIEKAREIGKKGA